MYTGTLPLPNNSFVRSTVGGNNKTYSETYSNRQDSMLSEIKYATTRRIARRICNNKTYSETHRNRPTFSKVLYLVMFTQ